MFRKKYCQINLGYFRGQCCVKNLVEHAAHSKYFEGSEGNY